MYKLNDHSSDKKGILLKQGRKLFHTNDELVDFVEQKVTQTIINQDLNTILPKEKFSRIRKVIKDETLTLLKDELKRLG